MEKRGGIREGERNDCRESFLFFSRFDARSEGGKERGDEGERNCFFGKGRRRRRKSCKNLSVFTYYFVLFSYFFSFLAPYRRVLLFVRSVFRENQNKITRLCDIFQSGGRIRIRYIMNLSLYPLFLYFSCFRFSCSSQRKRNKDRETMNKDEYNCILFLFSTPISFLS